MAADHIITLMYDDIAGYQGLDNRSLGLPMDSAFRNPYPGKLFNSPEKVDVYEGVKIDYKGDDVNPDNFIAILQGDKAKVKGGNGRVLERYTEKKNLIVRIKRSLAQRTTRSSSTSRTMALQDSSPSPTRL